MTKQQFAAILVKNRFDTRDPEQTLIAAWVGTILGQIVGYKLFRKLGARWAAYAIGTFAANKSWADIKREYKETVGS
jgi:hypothetical protein